MVEDIIGIGSITITDLNDASISIDPPRNPEVGDIWIDSSKEKNILRQFNGTKWIPASLDVSELDKDLSDKITTIESTLGNIGDDGVLTYENRKILVEELNLIIGEVVSTTSRNNYPTALPDYTTVESNASGSFSNYRIAAREVGIRESNSKYVTLEKSYTAMIKFLGEQGTPRPWDIRESTKEDVTTLTSGDRFRDVILEYYLAELALVKETGERAQDMVVSDIIAEDSGVTPFLALPTQAGGSLRIEIQGFYKKEPVMPPEGYAIEVKTQRAEKGSNGYVGVGEVRHVLVPLPKVILESESLLRDENGSWKIITPQEEIFLSKKAQKALENIPSFKKATYVTLSDSHNQELKVLIGVKSMSASWYREQQSKDYTDDAMSNTGSALDVEETGPYEIPMSPVPRVSEYTLEAFIYWKGRDTSSILARGNPQFNWRVRGQEYVEEVEINGELKRRDPETRGYIEFQSSGAYDLSTQSSIGSKYVPVNRWVGVTVTYDGARTKLFIEGELVASKSSGRTLGLEGLLLGGLEQRDWFDGYITNFRIWDKALSDADVKRYQNRRLDNDEPGLVMYYRLNGGNKIFDSGPHENHIEPDETIGWVDDKEVIQDLDKEIEQVSTRVTQLSDSWVLNIHSNDELVTQINASTEGVEVEGKSITLTGDTKIIGRLNIDARNLDERLEEDIKNKATKEEFKNLEIDTRNYLLDSGNRIAFIEQENIPTTGGPSNLIYAKEYALVKPLKQNQTYTISTETSGQGVIGVWAGKSNYLGQIIEGSLEFKAPGGSFETIIVKASTQETILDTIMLNRGGREVDWQPAPEDTEIRIEEVDRGVVRPNLIPSFQSDLWYLNEGFKEVPSPGDGEEQKEIIDFVQLQSAYTLIAIDGVNQVGNVEINVDKHTDYTMSHQIAGGRIIIRARDWATGEQLYSSVLTNNPTTLNTQGADLWEISLARAPRVAGNISFSQLKLEKGSKVSEWSPMSGDLDDITGALGAAQDKLNEQEIKLSATEEEVIEAIRKLGHQGIELEELSSLKIGDGMQSIEARLQRFSFSNNGIEIRPNVSDSKTRITLNSGGIYFYNGSEVDGKEVPVAKIESGELLIDKGIFVENMTIGDHSFEDNGSGRTTISYVGENE